MQSSMTGYFKVKKRAREDTLSSKSKLLALSEKDSSIPTPISTVTPTPSPEAESTNKSPVKNAEDKANPIPIPNNDDDDNVFSSPKKLKDYKGTISEPARRAVKRLFGNDNDSPFSASGSTPSKVPAFKRFQHLLEKTPDLAKVQKIDSKSLVSSPTKILIGSPSKDVPELPLPFKYKMLLEIFNSVETVASILHNRKEIITFAKLRPSVQGLFQSSTLRERHLAQISTVFPGCYEFSQEKLAATRGSPTKTYHLTLAVNLKATDSKYVGNIFSPGLMAERRKIFKQNLINMAQELHKEFLLKLDPPINIPDGKVVTRWHPSFRLDKIPEVKLQELPQPPGNNVATAKEAIEKAQNILQNANPRMKKAFQDLLKSQISNVGAKIEKEINEVDSKVKPSTTATTPQSQNTKDKKNLLNSQKLKGISQNLIERIREKEKEKVIRAMTLSPEETKEKSMMNRLPDYVKIIKNISVTEKKAALTFELVVERLSHSKYEAFSSTEISEHLYLLAKILPEWLIILKLSQGLYVKIDREANINELIVKIQQIIANLP